MALFETSKPELDFIKTNKLIYGWPKTGKSTLASLMKTADGRVPLFAATEDNHGSLSVSRARVTSWTGFLKFLDFIEGNAERLRAEHSCLVLDLVSDLDSWCATAVAKQKNVEYIGDMDQGKGWKLLREQFQAAIVRAMNLLPVTFIAHTQEKRVTWNGEQIVTQAPDLSKAALAYINGKVNAIMYIEPTNSKKDKPVITMAPSIAHIAGAHQKALCRAFTYDPDHPHKAWEEICRLYAQAQAQGPADTSKPLIQDAPAKAAAGQ